MKHYLKILPVLALAVLVSCSGKKAEKETPAQTAELVFLTNLNCESCVNTIQTKLPETDGVVNAVADVETKLVTVTFDPAVIESAGLIEAFANLGYDAQVYDTSAATAPENGADTADVVE